MFKAKNIYITALAAVMLASCDKQVDLQPTDFVPIERQFTSINDVNSGVLGVYGTWSARRAVYLSTIMADEARQGTGTEYRSVGAILFRWEHTSDAQDFRDGELGGVWTNMYQVIDRANRVLNFIDGVPVANATEQATKDRYKGELLALRAYAHFELLRTYSRSYDPSAPGVPYIKAYAAAPSSFYPSRNTSGEVAASIDADLKEAKNLIPATFADISRVTRNAVAAMQAKVALYTRAWADAVTYSTEVINAQPLTSRANYTTLWNSKPNPNTQATELIWTLEVAQANSGSAIGSLFQDGNGAVQFGPSTKLLNSYDAANDIRYNAFFRTEGSRTYLSKFGVNIPAASVTDNYLYDIKMLRTSEMYLIRAEAYAEQSNLTNAAADIFALRRERISGATLPAYATKEEAIEDVLLERYRELAFEGHRYYDLKRRNLPIVRLLTDVQNNSALVRLEPSNPKYLLPIPQQEVFANPNIEQNPGY